MTTSEASIETCNELLRGEMAAVETYTQAIEKFGDSESDDMLYRIRTDHEINVDELRKVVAESGYEPATGSGLWGSFAKGVEGAATLFGESPALKVLQEGEEHGLKEYREALKDPEVSPAIKELIRDEMIPALNDHIYELEQRRA